MTGRALRSAGTEGRSGILAFGKRLVLVSRPPARFLIYSLSPLTIYSGLPPPGLPTILLLVLLFNGFGEPRGE